MRVVAVSVGQAAPLFVSREGADAPVAPSRQVQSGIRKAPVSTLDDPRRIGLGALGFDGDEQVDRTVHGGRDKAVYAYPVEHYPVWRTMRAQGAKIDEPLPHGFIGENLTIEGLTETRVWIGDVLVLEPAEASDEPPVRLRVDGPRRPCFKFNVRMGFNHASKMMEQSGYCGFYLEVLQTGTVAAGDRIRVDAGRARGDDRADAPAGDSQRAAQAVLTAAHGVTLRTTAPRSSRKSIRASPASLTRNASRGRPCASCSTTFAERSVSRPTNTRRQRGGMRRRVRASSFGLGQRRDPRDRREVESRLRMIGDDEAGEALVAVLVAGDLHDLVLLVAIERQAAAADRLAVDRAAAEDQAAVLGALVVEEQEPGAPAVGMRNLVAAHDDPRRLRGVRQREAQGAVGLAHVDAADVDLVEARDTRLRDDVAREQQQRQRGARQQRMADAEPDQQTPGARSHAR